jgi:two-component system chemotaxis response regulator CheY
MRTLIIEDDLSNCLLLEEILSPHSECAFATTGKAALQEFINAHAQERTFDLLCLSVMMSDMETHQILDEIRIWEDEHRVQDNCRVRIIMTRAVTDGPRSLQLIQSQGESYTARPIERKHFLHEIESLGFVLKRQLIC